MKENSPHLSGNCFLSVALLELSRHIECVRIFGIIVISKQIENDIHVIEMAV